MAPKRAAAIRCCGPFLLPFSPVLPPQHRPSSCPFRGNSFGMRHVNFPSHPPKISPRRGIFQRKRLLFPSPITPRTSPRLPGIWLENDIFCGILVYFGLDFNAFFSKMSMRRIPPEREKCGRLIGCWLGRVWCVGYP